MTIDVKVTEHESVLDDGVEIGDHVELDTLIMRIITQLQNDESVKIHLTAQKDSDGNTTIEILARTSTPEPFYSPLPPHLATH